MLPTLITVGLIIGIATAVIRLVGVAAFGTWLSHTFVFLRSFENTLAGSDLLYTVFTWVVVVMIFAVAVKLLLHVRHQ